MQYQRERYRQKQLFKNHNNNMRRNIKMTYWMNGEAETIKFYTQSQALNFILTNKIKNFYFS